MKNTPSSSSSDRPSDAQIHAADQHTCKDEIKLDFIFQNSVFSFPKFIFFLDSIFSLPTFSFVSCQILFILSQIHFFLHIF